MNLNKIKTQKDFYAFADIWYQRTLRLKRAYEDTAKPKEYRNKAYILWWGMRFRMQKIAEIQVQMNTI